MYKRTDGGTENTGHRRAEIARQGQWVLVATVVAVGVVYLGGCSFAPNVEPDLAESGIPGEFANVNVEVDEDSVITDRWWETLGDDSLTSVVESAIESNLDLQLALSRIKQFEALFKVSRGARLPQVTASGSATQSETPIFLPDEFTQNNPAAAGSVFKNELTQYSLNAGLRFEIDVWGKLRNLEKAAVADLMALKADLQTVYLGLTAQVTSLYFEIRSLMKQKHLTDQVVESYEKDLDIQEWRYRNGIGLQLNVELTRQALAGAKARLASEDEALSAGLHQLAVLMGAYPDGSLASRIDTSENIREWDPIPVGLPSTLLKRRSDIASAEFGLEKARQLIGAARADFFPSFSLTGSIGYLSDDLKNIFSSDFLAKSLALNGTQTLFSGGIKKGTLNQRWAQYKTAELTYRKVVLEAFREVENSLVTMESVDLQLQAVQDQRQAAWRAFQLREDRYLKGIGQFDDALDARRSFFNAEAALIRAQKNFMLARVGLHKSLGGAWIDEKELAKNE